MADSKKPYHFGSIQRLSSAELMEAVSSNSSAFGGVKRLGIAEMVALITAGGIVFGSQRAEGEY